MIKCNVELFKWQIPWDPLYHESNIVMTLPLINDLRSGSSHTLTSCLTFKPCMNLDISFHTSKWQTSKWDKKIYIWKDITEILLWTNRWMWFHYIQTPIKTYALVSVCIRCTFIQFSLKNPFTSFRKHVWTKRNIKTSDSWTWWFNVPPLPLNLNLQWVIINVLLKMEE